MKSAHASLSGISSQDLDAHSQGVTLAENTTPRATCTECHDVRPAKGFTLPAAATLVFGDTIALKRERVKGNKLFLYPQKTGTAVYVPLPPTAVKALGQLEGDGEHFFTSGKAKPQTARANWSRYLDTVFALAKVKDAHSHRFRDTFAVLLLENGVSLENLSVLLGHSSVRITERHYKPWVRTLQRKLEEEVRKAWR